MRASQENPLSAVGLNGKVAVKEAVAVKEEAANNVKVTEREKFQEEVAVGKSKMKVGDLEISVAPIPDTEVEEQKINVAPVESAPVAKPEPVATPKPVAKPEPVARPEPVAAPEPVAKSVPSANKQPVKSEGFWPRVAEHARAAEAEAAKTPWGFLQRALWGTTAEAAEDATKNSGEASLVLGALALIAFVVLSLGLGQLKPPAAPVRTAPAPVVVAVSQTAPKPLPAQLAEKALPAAVSSVPASTPKATSSPALAPVAVSTSAPQAKPTPVASAPVRLADPASSQPVELPWARTLAETVAGGLRQLSDNLPAAERQLESNVPGIVHTAQWTATVNTDNVGSKVQEAAPVVGGLVAKGAEAVTRAGLEVGGAGLNVVGTNLPAVGKAVQSSVEAAMPAVQSGAHAMANAARDLAVKAADLQPEMLPQQVPVDVRNKVADFAHASPFALKAAASSVDWLADVAPGVEKSAAYALGKAVPVVQAVLGSASEVSQDAAHIDASQLPPLPEASQVAASLKAVGVDTDELAARAQEAAKNVAAQVQAKVASSINKQ